MRTTTLRQFSLSLVATAAVLAVPHLARAQMTIGMERGEYLATIMDCAGCHTPGAMTPQRDASRPLAGNDIGFELPDLGTFYPPNLTPDVTTGIGAWTDDEIARAIRTGERPDGRILAPIMPYEAYSALSNEDVMALVAYLKSLEPVSHKVPGPFGPDEEPPAPYLQFVFPAGGQ